MTHATRKLWMKPSLEIAPIRLAQYFNYKTADFNALHRS